MCNLIETLASLFFSSIISFIGGFDGLIKALLIFMLMRYVTTKICLIMRKTSKSQTDTKMIAKNIVIIILVGIAHTIDAYIITNAFSVLRTSTIVFYIFLIGKAILQNANAIGVPPPIELKEIIVKLCGDEDDKANSNQ